MSTDRWNEPNLAPTGVVRQHVVPRFWLAHFAVGGKIDVFEVSTGRHFTAGLPNVAVEARFYDVAAGRKHLSTETWLSIFEAEAAPLMDLLVDEPTLLPDLNPEQEDILARFLCAQLMRVPAKRKQEDAMRKMTVDHAKELGRRFTEKELGTEESAELWEFWDKKPDEFFLNEAEPYQSSITTASMLGEVQGFGNLLKAMPWRIGRASTSSLYLSDNPMSRYPLPTRRFAGFADHVYFVPLDTQTLLKIGHGVGSSRRGSRAVRDFNAWETSVARHVVTRDSDKYLFGPGPYVDEECALSCMRRFITAMGLDGYRLQGLDPRKP